MKKIIGILKPFKLTHDFYVYEDGNKIEVQSIRIKNLSDTLFTFKEKYNVNDIELIGPKKYTNGIKKQIENAEILKYNKNDFNIKII